MHRAGANMVLRRRDLARKPPIPDQTEGFDPATDFPSEPFQFPAETIESFKHILGVSDSEFEEKVLPRLRDIATDYRRWTAQREATPRRAKTNNELKKLAADAKVFARRLRGIDDDVLFQVFRHFDPSTVPDGESSSGGSRHHRLADELEVFSQAMRLAHRNVSRQTGPDANRDLPLAVGMLVEVYEGTTGMRATQHATQDGIYDGTPRSPAGRFLLAFFRSVDPRKPSEGAPSDSAISTALGEVASRKRKKQPD